MITDRVIVMVGTRAEICMLTFPFCLSFYVGIFNHRKVVLGLCSWVTVFQVILVCHWDICWSLLAFQCLNLTLLLSDIKSFKNLRHLLVQFLECASITDVYKDKSIEFRSVSILLRRDCGGNCHFDDYLSSISGHCVCFLQRWWLKGLLSCIYFTGLSS